MEASEAMGAPERKFHRPESGLRVTDGAVIEGYASLFHRCDQGGDHDRHGHRPQQPFAVALRILHRRGQHARICPWRRTRIRLRCALMGRKRLLGVGLRIGVRASHRERRSKEL
jgi:hypothetical protein